MANGQCKHSILPIIKNIKLKPTVMHMYTLSSPPNKTELNAGFSEEGAIKGRPCLTCSGLHSFCLLDTET